MSDLEFFEEDLIDQVSDRPSEEEAIESDSDDVSTLHYQLVRLLLDLTSHMIVV